jgi:hypothetical protein
MCDLEFEFLRKPTGLRTQAEAMQVDASHGRVQGAYDWRPSPDGRMRKTGIIPPGSMGYPPISRSFLVGSTGQCGSSLAYAPRRPNVFLFFRFISPFSGRFATCPGINLISGALLLSFVIPTLVLHPFRHKSSASRLISSDPVLARRQNSWQPLKLPVLAQSWHGALPHIIPDRPRQHLQLSHRTQKHQLTQ